MTGHIDIDGQTVSVADIKETLRVLIRMMGTLSEITRESREPHVLPPDVPRDRAPRNYSEQRALLDDSLRDVPPAEPTTP
jgi:hypothetical protein